MPIFCRMRCTQSVCKTGSQKFWGTEEIQSGKAKTHKVIELLMLFLWCLSSWFPLKPTTDWVVTKTQSDHLLEYKPLSALEIPWTENIPKVNILKSPTKQTERRWMQTITKHKKIEPATKLDWNRCILCQMHVL